MHISNISALQGFRIRVKILKTEGNVFKNEISELRGRNGLKLGMCTTDIRFFCGHMQVSMLTHVPIFFDENAQNLLDTENGVFAITKLDFSRQR